MAEKSFCPRFRNVPALLVLCLLIVVPVFAQEEDEAGGALWSKFKATSKSPCGKRAEAVKTGKQIIEQYAHDEQNSHLVEYLKKKLPIIEKEEKECRRKNPGKSLAELFEDFKTARKFPCGERGEAVQISQEIIDRFSDDKLNKEVIDYVKNVTPVIAEDDKKCRAANSLETLFADYKSTRKLACGERRSAIQTGRLIISLHGSSELHQDIIGFVEKDVAAIEEQDRVCQRNARYNQYYREKNWRGVFTVSKEIIEEEGDKPLALDVMLTLVSVGHRLAAYDGDTFYNGDTVFYAKKAIDLIEDGVKTQSGWGVFEPYGSKEKALAWMNYSIGYITYFRDKEGKKAIPYFYKATQYSSEFKYDAFVYHAVAIHYFDREAVTVSSLSVNDFITKANNIEMGNAITDSAEETAKNNEIAMLYKQLVNLYNLRYSLAPNENAFGLTDYIQKLINRPLVNTSTSGTRRNPAVRAVN